MQYTSIKYIPTGNVFKMPTSNAEEILKTDRGNYEIVGGENIPEEKQEAEVTETYDMVVEQDDNTQDDNSESQEEISTQDDVESIKRFTKTSLKSLKVEQLVELCKEKNIEVTEDDKKADLIEKLLATVEE